MRKTFSTTLPRTRNTRFPWLAVGLALSLGVPAIASAATQAGLLPSSATEAVLLSVECSDDGSGLPASMTASIRDLNPVLGPVVSLQLRRNFAAKSTTDPVDGDAAASPIAILNEGAGHYDLYVDKNGVGEESFEVSAQCWTGTNGTGVATGTVLRSTQGAPVPSLLPPAAVGLIGSLCATGLIGIARHSGRRRCRGRARTGAHTLPRRLVLVPIAGAAGLATSIAEAHSQPGSLGVAASATDYYEVTCYDDGHGVPGSLEIQIRDASPGAAPFVSAQAHAGSIVRSVSDDVVADILPSPQAFVNGGAATYFVLVDKSGSGGKFYDLTYHCWTGPDGTGIHTGSFLVPRQSE